MILEVITEKVIKCAVKTGAYIRQERESFSFDKVSYKGVNDLVSHVDKESEVRIIRELKQILPDASILAEEGHNETKSSNFKWVIDPLDGTTNFVHGLPAFAISIALLENDSPIVGVIYEISRDECFSAFKNGGSKLNGKPISISDHKRLKDCLMATGFPVTQFERIPILLKILEAFVKKSHGVRRFGSAAMDLAYVACGRFDGFFEYNLNAWDVAAGVLIVNEAGGKVTDFSGGTDFIYGKQILAGNKAHGEMLDILKEFWT
jgi:myo-inositol-1(or 4)-monophosphatase